MERRDFRERVIGFKEGIEGLLMRDTWSVIVIATTVKIQELARLPALKKRVSNSGFTKSQNSTTRKISHNI